MSDYNAVQEALKGGADPAMLCATCPWDRLCIAPPVMSDAEVQARLDEAKAEDQQKAAAARAAGLPAGMPQATIMAVLAYGGMSSSTPVCPVLALRLRTSAGQKIATGTKMLMQSWDDQS